MKPTPFLLACCLLIPCLLKAQPQEFSTYANEDYKAYQNSPMSKPAWDPFVKEGFEAMDRKDIQSSIEFLRKALNLGCTSPIVYFKMALSYESFSSYYSAVQYYELALQQFKLANQDHRYAKIFLENYGRALYLMGQKDRAMVILEQAVAESNAAWVLKLLADIYLEKKDNLALATTYYERYLSHPAAAIEAKENIALNLFLARTTLNNGDQALAKKYYERILVLDPSHQEAQRFVANQQKINKKSSIDESMEKLLDIIK